MGLSKLLSLFIKTSTLLSLSVACGQPVVAAEESWPTKPVRFVVPFVAGGAADITMRSLAQLLTTSLGQTMLVENKVGGGGNIGTDLVAKSAPDGYTFLLTYTGPFAINPHLYKKLPFDPKIDFSHVTLIADAPLILTIHPSLPAGNLAELITYLKANPEKVFYGSAGTGSAGHLGGALFMLQTGTHINHIPFKGGAQAVVELVAGRIQMEFLTIPGGLSHIRTGKLRAIAMVSDQRFPLFPDIPTMTEAGMANFALNNWYGISAPAGTPAPIVKRMNQVLREALQDPGLRTRFQDIGLVPISNTPEEFSAFIQSDSERWQQMVQASGATAE
ncbi:MAG: tripartite tricarboxylate transporter substrate binding protein [Alcaligenaceae bacterium]